MGRPALNIDKDEFQAVVNLLEAKNTFNSRNALWQAVENTDWAKSQKPVPLKSWTVASNAEKLNITIKTPGKELNKEDGPANIETNIDEFPILPVPEISKPTIIKNVRGKPVKFCKNEVHVPVTDLRQAVINKCMDCSGNSRENVASCHVKSCPLYAVRPYKKESENVSSL